jgi:hypothetical protein
MDGLSRHQQLHHPDKDSVDFNQDLEAGGVKFDIGKPRMDLVPPNAMLELGRLYALGADKYSDRNWEKGMDQARTLAAASRHLEIYKTGEDFDTDDYWAENNLEPPHHLIQIAWNALSLYELTVCGMIEDQRTKLRPAKKEGIVGLDRTFNEKVFMKEYPSAMPNDEVCSVCGQETMCDIYPNKSLTTDPPQKRTGCINCGTLSYRKV